MVPERTRTKLECCRKWEDLGPADRARLAWQVLHQLAHSRVPFSVERLADLARLSVVDANNMIGVAKRRSWVMPVKGTKLYAGVLAHR